MQGEHAQELRVEETKCQLYNQQASSVSRREAQLGLEMEHENMPGRMGRVEPFELACE